jgi:hypothetical protein
MNEEKLRFVSGETNRLEEVVEVIDVSDEGSTDNLADLYAAGIHVIGEYVWPDRIVVHGESAEAAEGLRDRLLWALNQPTVPVKWQARKTIDGVEDIPWYDLDNGGEAARLKGEGYEIRALYAKQPLKEV